MNEVGNAQPQVALIELSGISKTYGQGELATRVLHGINLKIFPGELVAIVGASGSGKSTLMNILGCLDQPTSGSYRFMGRDVSKLTRDELAELRRDAFGFIFQQYHLIATHDALGNVEVPAIYAGLPAAKRHARAAELLKTLGLGDRMHHLPRQLSGGQQQRVSIARALMNGGRVILADEPTGALDSTTGAEVMDRLKALAAQGHTVIIITHDAQVAANAQRIIEIKDGRIVSDPGAQAPLRETALAVPQKTRRRATPLGDMVEAAKTAFRALRANVFRAVLTLLGIVIGVASVIAMLAIGDGAKQAVIDRISAMGSNLLLVRPGAPNQRGLSGTATLVLADVQAIDREVPNVLAAVPEQSSNATLRYDESDYSSSILGTTYKYPLARQWNVSHGTFFTEQDELEYATVAVLGQTVAKALFPGVKDFNLVLGQHILIGNLIFQVTGVMSPRGASPFGQDQDDIVFVPYPTSQLRLSGQRYLRNATVAVADTSRMDETQAAVEALLTERHGGIVDFQIRNMASIIDTATETQNTMTMLLGSIAAISLLVGGIGVMNIMLVSVTERTREIGIRMATGAQERNILQQFLIEALVVSALGGLIGVFFGLGTAALIEATGRPVVYSAGPVVLAFGCAFATGLIFGWLPARKAARLDPVVALSSE